jgi:energy-converting hydrogenase Eha subunit B
VLVAEADGNRTRQAGDARLNGFEDRGAHQDPDASMGMIPSSRGAGGMGGASLPIVVQVAAVVIFVGRRLAGMGRRP